MLAPDECHLGASSKESCMWVCELHLLRASVSQRLKIQEADLGGSRLGSSPYGCVWISCLPCTVLTAPHLLTRKWGSLTSYFVLSD